MARIFSTDDLCRWADSCVQALGEQRADIDALNVFPVPDSDTGTNLVLTMEAAAAAVGDARDAGADVVAAARALCRGALLGARGNSGVILAQLLRAGFSRLAHDLALDQLRDFSDERAPRAAGPEPLEGPPARPFDGVVLANAVEAASDAAYAAGGEPVAGPSLTVARAGAPAGGAPRRASRPRPP